jgi:hypothetical protein
MDKCGQIWTFIPPFWPLPIQGLHKVTDAMPPQIMPPAPQNRRETPPAHRTRLPGLWNVFSPIPPMRSPINEATLTLIFCNYLYAKAFYLLFSSVSLVSVL